MDIKSKIEEIDLLLDDNKEFDKYINNIENTNIFVNENLKNKLLDKILVKKYNKISVNNILKIAACMIFSLAVWRAINVSGENINIKNDNYNAQKVYMNLQDKFDEISAFMMNPKIFEGGED